MPSIIYFYFNFLYYIKTLIPLPMFKAVNSESEAELKKINDEMNSIRDLYLKALKTLNASELLEFKVKYENNKDIHRIAISNILYNSIKAEKFDKKLLQKHSYDISDSKSALFAYILHSIESKKFIKAKKLLNAALSKGWEGNEYYECLRLLNEIYVDEEIINENIIDDIRKRIK